MQMAEDRLGMVSAMFVRVVNSSDGKEIARYDLSEDSSMETAMIFALIIQEKRRMESKQSDKKAFLRADWVLWQRVMVSSYKNTRMQ